MCIISQHGTTISIHCVLIVERETVDGTRLSKTLDIIMNLFKLWLSSMFFVSGVTHCFVHFT